MFGRIFSLSFLLSLLYPNKEASGLCDFFPFFGGFVPPVLLLSSCKHAVYFSNREYIDLN